MSHASDEKRKTHLTDGMELPNQDEIRTPGQKETNPSMGILEANTIKQQEDERKNWERIFLENQKATRDKTMWQNTLSKE